MLCSYNLYALYFHYFNQFYKFFITDFLRLKTTLIDWFWMSSLKLTINKSLTVENYYFHGFNGYKFGCIGFVSDNTILYGLSCHGFRGTEKDKMLPYQDGGSGRAAVGGDDGPHDATPNDTTRVVTGGEVVRTVPTLHTHAAVPVHDKGVVTHLRHPCQTLPHARVAQIWLTAVVTFYFYIYNIRKSELKI